MPKRYFPFSQDFNSDPEGWELTDTFGDRMLRVWLELLAIADRGRSGIIKGTAEDWAKLLARKVFSKNNPKWFKRDTETVHKAILWMAEKQWLFIIVPNSSRELSERLQRAIREGSESDQRSIRDVSEPSLVIGNYWKYHKTRSEVRIPPNPPNLPNPLLLKKEDKEPAPPEPSAGLKVEEKREPEKRSVMDPDVKVACDAVYRIDPQKFARLVVWVKQAEKAKFSNLVIAESLRAFLPYVGSVDGNWWAYLDKLCYKTDQRINVREHEREHAEKKREVREASLRLMG